MSRRSPGARIRCWLVAGAAGLLVVAAVPAVRDAWQVNQAGIVLNRAIVESGASIRAASARVATAPETGDEPVILATSGDYQLTPEAKALLERSLALMEDAADRGPHTASREVPIWRTYGAAARMLPSDHAFELLSRSRNAGRLDWYGQLWFGEVASATGRWSEAADAYRRVDVSNLLVYRAEAHIKAGEKELALRELTLAKMSLDALVDRERARLLLLDRTGNQPSAMTGMLTRPAERATTLYRIGHALLSLGLPSDARPILEEGLAAAETSSPGAGTEVNLRFDLAAALAATLPEGPPGTGDRAYSYYTAPGELDRLTGVIHIRALLHQALALDASARSYTRAGTILMTIGDERLGLSMLDRAIQADPRSPDAYIGLGDYYDRHLMGYVARTLYQHAAELMPDEPAIISALAVSTFKTSSHADALPLLERAAGMGTTNPYVFAFLGDCYSELGRTADAAGAWNKGLERFPDDPALKTRLDALPGATPPAQTGAGS